MKAAVKRFIGLGLLTTLFTACAGRMPLANIVPENAHPDMSAEFSNLRLEMIRQTLTKPAQNNNTGRAVYLHSFLNCGEFTSVQNLAQQPPDQMEKSARQILRDRYDRSPQNAARDYAGNYREALCQDLISLDIMPREGLTDEERDLWSKFQENVTADSAYSAWEKQRMDEAVNGLLRNHEFATTFEQWKKQGQYQTAEEARQQYNLRHTVLQKISDEIRGAFGLQPIPVYMVVFPKDLPVTGYHQPHGNYIVVNYLESQGITNDLQTALLTLVEETKHSVDQDLQKQRMAGVFNERDIRATHTALIIANDFNYTLPAYSSTLIGQAAYDRRWNSYERQYVERNAKEFQDRFTHALMTGLQNRPAAHTIVAQHP
jgi:hypothetical protein